MGNNNQQLKVEIGQRFKRFREFLNLNQSQMGHMLGLSQTTINGIEKGKSFPTPNAITFLMKSHHLSSEWLLSGNGLMSTFQCNEEKNYGAETELMKDFLYHIDNCEMVRLAMLSYFIGYKSQHAEIISTLLDNKNETVTG